MAYKATEIRLDPETRATLEGWVRATKTEQRYVKRARIVLLAADGMGSRAIAREVRMMPGIVSIWRDIARLVGAAAVALIDQVKPQIQTLADQCSSLSKAVSSSVAAFESGDMDGANLFMTSR